MHFTIFALGQLTIVWAVYHFAYHRGFYNGLVAMRDAAIDVIEQARSGHVR